VNGPDDEEQMGELIEFPPKLPPPAGWYRTEWDLPNVARWWNGEGWTSVIVPIESPLDDLPR
jgi:hypothetical protein